MKFHATALALSLLGSVSTVQTAGLAQARGKAGAQPAAAGQTLITTIPDTYQTPKGGWAPRCSADRTVCAYVAQKGADVFVVANGTAGPAYEEVKDVVFSADSRHIAYAARRKTSWMVVLDGKEGTGYDKIDNLMFIGAKPIYLGFRPPAARNKAGTFGGSSDIEGFRDSRKAGVQAVMAVGEHNDDIPVVEDRFTGINDLRISPDGSSYAYVIRMSAGPYGLWLLMLNGEEQAEDHGIKVFGFTKDGRLAFARRTGSAVNGHAKVQVGKDDVGDRPANIVGDVVAGATSPDGRKLLYVTCIGKAEDGKCSLMTGLDAKVIREGALGAPALAPDGTISFTERQADGKVKMFVGEQAGPPVDSVSGAIVFSADSKRHAYPAAVAGKSVVVVDGVVGPAFDAVAGPRFSADGKHVVYDGVINGAHQIVLDQVARPASYAWLTEPDFDAAGTTVRFVAQEGRSFSRRSLAVGR